MQQEKDQPFGAVLRNLLLGREEFLTHTGNINWMLVSEQLPDVYYETLRKAVAGDRNPSPDLMEKTAALAGVSPEVFAEYRLWQARRLFDVKEVGWQEAMDNLRQWAAASARPSRKKT